MNVAQLLVAIVVMAGALVLCVVLGWHLRAYRAETRQLPPSADPVLMPAPVNRWDGEQWDYPGRPGPPEPSGIRRPRHGAREGYWDTDTGLFTIVYGDEETGVDGALANAAGAKPGD